MLETEIDMRKKENQQGKADRIPDNKYHRQPSNNRQKVEGNKVQDGDTRLQGKQHVIEILEFDEKNRELDE